MSGAALNFNAANVQPSKALDPIPSGWYNASISDTTMKPTQKPGGQMLQVELTILDGEFAGRKVWDRLNLVNENATAVQIGYETLSAICHATGVINIQQSTAELHGIPLKVKVKLRGAETGADGKAYDATNEVKGYDHIKSDHATGPSGPVTAVGVAGAPVGTPVWATAAPVAPAAAPVPQAVPSQPFQPPVAAPQPWQAAAPAPVAAPAQPFVAPPVPAAPVVAGPVMLPAANGVPYESYIQNGWTDALLIQHGMMAAPVAAPVAPVAPAPVAPPVPGAQPVPAAPAVGQAPPWAT